MWFLWTVLIGVVAFYAGAVMAKGTFTPWRRVRGRRRAEVEQP